MKQEPEPEGLTPFDEITPADRADWLDKTLRQGAEPYWMQDIRLAQRAIEAARARLRAAQSPGSSEPE